VTKAAKRVGVLADRVGQRLHDGHVLVRLAEPGGAGCGGLAHDLGGEARPALGARMVAMCSDAACNAVAFASPAALRAAFSASIAAMRSVSAVASKDATDAEGEAGDGRVGGLTGCTGWVMRWSVTIAAS
jgi:hypothetical protein